jgi:hypothetical protein
MIMPQTNSLERLLDELDQRKRTFEPGSARRLSGSLAALGQRRFRDATSLTRFHEALLYCRAYPQGPVLLREAEKLLASFHTRVTGVNPDAFEEPEVSGIVGTAFSAVFSYEVVRRLAGMEPGRLGIDWERYELTCRVAGAWRRLFPLVEEDTMVEAHVPYLEWLRAAAGGLDGALACLLARLAQLSLAPKDKADLYASLELPVRWELGRTEASRTTMRGPAGTPFYHDGPLIRRTEVSLDHEFAAEPLPCMRLSEEAGQAFLNMALAASAARQRELHGFTFGDPRTVLRAQAGRGVEVFLCGVPSGQRLPLRAYHAAMMLKNGVPIGYFETLSLCDRMEVGFNLYYTFREGETAWIFARVLRLFHQVLGTTCFSIDPYQIGLDNEEAIESGAFWFYRKLGFRPVLPEVVRLLTPEECNMLKKTGYRTPAAILRRLAVGPLIFEMNAAPQGDWDRFAVRNIGLAVQRLKQEEAVARVSQALGIKAGPHGEFVSLAMAFALIPDLERWPQADKTALVEIIRAKMGPDESLYVRLTQKHARLRAEFVRLGRQPA